MVWVRVGVSMSDATSAVSIRNIVGGGYEEFWNFKGRYRLVKGGRGSKKSTTTALWYIYNMMYYYYRYGVMANLLVIRAYKVDHMDTTYTQLMWAINKLGVEHLWKPCRNPMQIIFRPTGQKILFRGMDSSARIKSITAAVGNLCWVWWEEAFEIAFYEDVETVNMSIRGSLPEPLFYQHTFTFNPAVPDHWLKKRFYDQVGPDGLSEDGQILAITRNFDCNEFLDESFLYEMERLRRFDPDRYRVVAMGEWGTNGGIIYTKWRIESFAWTQKFGDGWVYRYGMDFGFVESPTAIVKLAVNRDKRLIYVCDAVYLYAKVSTEIAEACRRMGIAECPILADSSHQMAIEEIRRNGVRRIDAVKKGAGSVIVGIERCKEYTIVVERHCEQFIREIASYRWKKNPRDEGWIDEPDDYQEDHGLDAMRYAMSQEEAFDTKFMAELRRHNQMRMSRRYAIDAE